MDLYASGETGDTVFRLMAEKRKKHRGGAVYGESGQSKTSYERNRNFSLT